MLLRQITEHAKAQNWMAVGFDFVSVGFLYRERLWNG